MMENGWIPAAKEVLGQIEEMRTSDHQSPKRQWAEGRQRWTTANFAAFPKVDRCKVRRRTEAASTKTGKVESRRPNFSAKDVEDIEQRKEVPQEMPVVNSTNAKLLPPRKRSKTHCQWWRGAEVLPARVTNMSSHHYVHDVCGSDHFLCWRWRSGPGLGRWFVEAKLLDRFSCVPEHNSKNTCLWATETAEFMFEMVRI